MQSERDWQWGSMEVETKPQIRVIGMGGTIASVDAGVERGDGKDGAFPRLEASELVAQVRNVSHFARVSCYSFCQVASASLGIEDMLGVFAEIRAAFSEGIDGVVVTQGTDTLEETGFVLDVLHDGPEPLVLTGAMRHASSSGADGPANLVAAIQVAAASESRGVGVVVVMADEIHAARWVTKRHTTKVAAFTSPMTGPIGWVSEGQTRIAVRPVGRPTMVPPPPEALPRVALVALGAGDDGRLLPHLPRLGYAGVVIEALGAGHVPAQAVAAVSAVAAQIPVVIASRTGCGELLRNTYGFSGSEMDLLSRGVLSAGALSAPKARLVLTLLLANAVPPAKLAVAFAKFAMPFQSHGSD